MLSTKSFLAILALAAAQHAIAIPVSGGVSQINDINVQRDEFDPRDMGPCESDDDCDEGQKCSDGPLFGIHRGCF